MRFRLLSGRARKALKKQPKALTCPALHSLRVFLRNAGPEGQATDLRKKSHLLAGSCLSSEGGKDQIG